VRRSVATDGNASAVVAVPLAGIATMRDGTSSPIESVNACSTEIE
jgi:hypothetical protein